MFNFDFIKKVFCSKPYVICFTGVLEYGCVKVVLFKSKKKLEKPIFFETRPVKISTAFCFGKFLYRICIWFAKSFTAVFGKKLTLSFLKSLSKI